MDLFTKIKNHKEVWVGLVVLGMLVASLFLFFIRSGDEKKESASVTLDTLLLEEDTFSLEQADTVSANDVTADETVVYIVVDVKGAVKQPGVFSLKSNQRVIDAIDAAEGLTENAETKHINFAQLLKDEMFIYIPTAGEELPIVDGITEAANENEAKININEANEQTLLELNGIGPSKASEIIKYREENGPFKSVEDILNVSGIGEKTLEKMQEQIIID